MDTVILSGTYFPVVDFLSSAATAVVLGYGGWLAFNGHISIGILVAFLGYLSNFFDPVQQLSQLYNTFLSAVAALDKITDLLDEEPEVLDSQRAVGVAREEVIAAARAVGADEFIERLEDGYETQLGERGSRLSLGQRQLIAFARALLADPRILILDEATSSVDIGTERKIERALRRLLHGRTAFIIAHRLSTIRDADLIVVLEHGQVVQQGSHDELRARQGAYQ